MLSRARNQARISDSTSKLLRTEYTAANRDGKLKHRNTEAGGSGLAMREADSRVASLESQGWGVRDNPRPDARLLEGEGLSHNREYEDR